jgi:hypothetical protein
MTRLREAAEAALAYMDSVGQQDMHPEEWAVAETLRAALEKPERHVSYVCPQCYWSLEQPEQEPVAWRNAALRVGEDLCSVGPFGYYNMTAKQWLDWALSVVTVHAPPRREWRGLTEIEICDIEDVELTSASSETFAFARAIEAALKERNQ